MVPDRTLVAFHDRRRLALGSPPEIARMLAGNPDAVRGGQVLVLDAVTGEPVDLDLRGTPDEAAARAAAACGAATRAPAARPGRPRLGVVSREITLLPRHWDWLNAQPGGASVTLRRLVDAARRDTQTNERVRRTQDRAYRFMSAVAGDLPGFEEAARALYAWDLARLWERTSDWPRDVLDQLREMIARHEGRADG